MAKVQRKRAVVSQTTRQTGTRKTPRGRFQRATQKQVHVPRQDNDIVDVKTGPCNTRVAWFYKIGRGSTSSGCLHVCCGACSFPSGVETQPGQRGVRARTRRKRQSPRHAENPCVPAGAVALVGAAGPAPGGAPGADGADACDMLVWSRFQKPKRPGKSDERHVRPRRKKMLRVALVLWAWVGHAWAQSCALPVATWNIVVVRDAGLTAAPEGFEIVNSINLALSQVC